MNTNFLSQERILELTEKYQLVPYQFDAFKKLNKSCDLCGKSILEIGGSDLPREVIFDDFGCKKWVAVRFDFLHSIMNCLLIKSIMNARKS